MNNIVKVDRIEGNYIIIEYPNKTFKIISKSIFPNAKDGDSIDLDKKIIINNDIDYDRIKKKVDDLFV